MVYTDFNYRDYLASLKTSTPMDFPKCPVGDMKGKGPYLGVDQVGEFLFWIDPEFLRGRMLVSAFVGSSIMPGLLPSRFFPTGRGK